MAFIVAVSPATGAGLKLKVPPVSPKIVTVPPPQVGVTSNALLKIAPTITESDSFNTKVQPDAGAILLSINVKLSVWFIVTAGKVTMELPDASNAIVWLGPPLTLYVIVVLGVPTMLNTASSPTQIGVLTAVTVATNSSSKVIQTCSMYSQPKSSKTL